MTTSVWRGGPYGFEVCECLEIWCKIAAVPHRRDGTASLWRLRPQQQGGGDPTLEDNPCTRRTRHGILNAG